MKNNRPVLYISFILISSLILYFISRSVQNSNQPSTSNNLNLGTGRGTQVNRQNCLSDDCLLVDNLEFPVGEISADAKNALVSAINDEYHALSFYEAVIKKFGQVKPFIMIKNAEQQHINSLTGIFDKYGIKVPVNTWVGKLTVPITLKEACQAGYEAEVKNANLYQDQLLPAITTYPEITQVFTNLMNASLLKHLVAFDRCN